MSHLARANFGFVFRLQTNSWGIIKQTNFVGDLLMKEVNRSMLISHSFWEINEGWDLD